MLHRLLPLFLIIASLIYLIVNFQDIRRDLVYRLHISGDPTTSCCTVDQVLSASGDFDENASMAIFNGQIVNYPKTSLAHAFSQSIASQTKSEEQVLGTTNAQGEEKWIEISLAEQKVKAWEGQRLVMEFPISSGKWAPTPIGSFYIWYKTRSQVMSGGSKELGTYYYLPNVPHNMFFYQGYALHGAYWHNNFGSPMSHGCVNAPLANAAQIFDWAGPYLPPGQNAIQASADNPGTKVVVR